MEMFVYTRDNAKTPYRLALVFFGPVTGIGMTRNGYQFMVVGLENVPERCQGQQHRLYENGLRSFRVEDGYDWPLLLPGGWKYLPEEGDRMAGILGHNRDSGYYVVQQGGLEQGYLSALRQLGRELPEAV